MNKLNLYVMINNKIHIIGENLFKNNKSNEFKKKKFKWDINFKKGLYIKNNFQV